MTFACARRERLGLPVVGRNVEKENLDEWRLWRVQRERIGVRITDSGQNKFSGGVALHPKTDFRGPLRRRRKFSVKRSGS